ncbi:MAG: FAD:protein FMN transferase [Deltaproteobacteria bacterium]|nr:FAD:protein FMN transferase [Deltaproteobacteria bacterium]
MKFFKITSLYLIISFFIFQSSGFAFQTTGRQYAISGKTMGTFYTIKFISHKSESLSLWEEKVDTLLKEVNRKLSMFDAKSEISLFNKKATGKLVTISPEFYAVILTGKKLYRMTNGAWDASVKPLVDLWGFGTENSTNKIPDPGKIAVALSKVGFNHIAIKGTNAVQKTKPITLDFGSIAKGYGVDAVAKLFTSSGINDVLVEIGGELYASGKNRKGKYWSVGISKPDKIYINQGLYKIIRLDNKAIATSGNYRNFFEIKGKTFSHIIDPKTGFPVDNGIVSASVISQNCTFADGLATALMVMDLKKGIRLVNSLEDTECLIIQKKGQKLLNHASKNFGDLVVK